LLPLFHDIDYRIASPRVRRLTLRNNPPYLNYAEIGKAERVSSPAIQRIGGGVIRVPVAGDLPSLDPSLLFTVVQGEVSPIIFETLTREDEGARIVPLLASDFRVEEGGRRFRIRLREDVRFHDGRRLTARDVRYSFERLLQNKESKSRSLLSPIRGARELLNGEVGDLAGFRILSALEFTIELEQPVSFFPALLAHNPAAIVPEGTDQFNGSWREGCVGTGPFRVVRFEPSRRLELEANPYYWRQGYPKGDGLIFTFNVSPKEILAGFRSGQFSLAWDLFSSDVHALSQESQFASKYRETPRLSTYYVAFNIHRGPFVDEQLRNRLVRSVDVVGLVRRNLGSLAIPAYGLIPPGLLGYEPWRRAPWSTPQKEDSVEEVELTGMINPVYEGPYSDLARALFNDLRENGFRVRVVHETKAEYYKALAAATVDLVASRWISDYPDADTFVHGLLHSENGII